MKKAAWFEHLTPLFLAIFPILSLAFENIEFVQFNSILRSLLISILITATFYLCFMLILRDQRKSAILSGLLIFLLLTYGNTYLSLENWIGEANVNNYLLVLFVILYLLVGLYIVYKVKDARELNLAIFTGGFVITIYLLFSIGYYHFKVYQAGVKSSDSISSDITEDNISDLPDIYLILLDGYTRSDILKNVYDFDNSEFTDQLEEFGFWVADCSKSNYPGTNFSTKALFEMDYLHTIYSDFDNLVFPPLNNTSVFRILNNNNYSTVTFQNFVFEHFDIKDDIKLEKEGNQFGGVNEFEKMVVDTSILRILYDMEGVFPESWLNPFKKDFYLTHYRDTLYALDTLPNLPEMKERLFVYAHLLVTHDPFVFMPDGSFNTSKQINDANYRNTVAFISDVLPEIVEEIIDKSEDPPIIIIMGDHGATIKGKKIEERFPILFAIYSQGEEPIGFYEDISPVNIFRIIFNNLFDLDYEILDDRSYDIWETSDLGDTYKRRYPPCSP